MSTDSGDNSAPNEGLVDWLLACPEKGYFVPIESANVSITLTPREASRFLAALDDPSSFEDGLSTLIERPSVLES
jgi:hypothetical protein